jgi:hypothetical protein
MMRLVQSMSSFARKKIDKKTFLKKQILPKFVEKMHWNDDAKFCKNNPNLTVENRSYQIEILENRKFQI